MTAKEYLLEIGFDDAHLPELFNNDDKSYYQITELIEEYHQAKLKLLGIGVVSKSLPSDIEIGEAMSKLSEIADKESER